MSVQLADLPRYVFSTSHITNRATSYHYNDSRRFEDHRKFMEIPLNNVVFEVPVIAFQSFLHLVRHGLDNTSSEIVVELFSEEDDLRYVSVDRYMRDVLVDDYSCNHLLKCMAKNGQNQVKYYGTHGAVFDSQFNPVMMCSWLMEKTVALDSDAGITYKYKFLCPIVRIDPYVYLSQKDSMEKFIVRKFANQCIDNLRTPNVGILVHEFTNGNGSLLHLSLRIEPNPFPITILSAPDINTTNEELRQVALEHINDIIQ